MAVNRPISAEDLFAALAGVEINGTLLRIESAAADSFAGSPYLYRVVLIG